jgi:hypothetical protein
VHLSTRTGKAEVIRKGGGEEARIVRALCDVCAAHGDNNMQLLPFSGMIKRKQAGRRRQVGLTLDEGLNDSTCLPSACHKLEWT